MIPLQFEALIPILDIDTIGGLLIGISNWLLGNKDPNNSRINNLQANVQNDEAKEEYQ